MGLPVHGLLQRDHFAHLRVGIQRAVGVILDGDGGQVFARGAELVHVAARDHGEQRSERGAGPDLARAIARPGQNFGHPRRRLRSHFLDPHHQHDVVDPAGDSM